MAEGAMKDNLEVTVSAEFDEKTIKIVPFKIEHSVFYPMKWIR